MKRSSAPTPYPKLPIPFSFFFSRDLLPNILSILLLYLIFPTVSVHFPPPSLKFYADRDFCFWYLKDCSVYNEPNRCLMKWAKPMNNITYSWQWLSCPHECSCSLCIQKQQQPVLLSVAFWGLPLSSPCSPHAHPLLLWPCLAVCCPLESVFQIHALNMGTAEITFSEHLDLRDSPGSHIHAFHPSDEWQF